MKNYSKKDMVLQFIHGAKHYFVYALVFSCLTAFLDMLRPKIIEFTIDGILNNDLSAFSSFIQNIIQSYGGLTYFKEHLYIVAILVIICTLGSVICNYFYQIMIARGGESFVKKMRDSLFEHIQHSTLAWHTENQTGDIIQRCTMDVDEVKVFLSDHLVNFIKMLILVVFSIIFMLQVNIKLGCIALCIIPIMITFSYIFHKKIGASFLECDESEGVLSTIAQENLTGVRIVRAFGKEQSEKDKFSIQNEDVTNKWIDVGKYLSLFWGINDVIIGLGMMAILVIGSSMCVHHTLTLGGLLAFIAYLTMLIRPIRSLGRILSEMSKTGVSLQRLYEIMCAPLEDSSSTLAPPLDKDIVFDHVSYTFGDQQVLDDISFTIKANSTLGILGNTGSGKSTLVHLLSRLYPLDAKDGKITIGGIDIQDMNVYWVRQNVGIVLQEPFLFSRSIKDNISIANNELTIEDIRNYTKVAALEKSIDSFPSGFDTFVGERGVTLSGGQKQRAAIARTLSLQTPIIIFDDSLSAVDTQTDEEIRRNLKSYIGNVTTIIISHRITTLMDSDQIVVLEDGKIKDSGTHEELLSRPGLYRTIYDIQQGKEEFQ